MQHKNIPLGDVHKPHNWEFANTAARDASAPTSDDVGKWAFLLDTQSYWRLASVAPTAWTKSFESPAEALAAHQATLATASTDATTKANAAAAASTPIAHAGSTGAAHGNATTSVAGFMAAADKTKLDGVATGATNYTHPANHPASIITQDASNRFVTDAEKAAWNAKEGAIAAGTTAQFYRGDKTWQALNAAAAGATTVGGNLFTLTNPSAVTFPRFNADNTVSTLDAASFRTAIGAGTSSTTGTVTMASVATANGFAGTVATATSTPAITITISVTGLLKGNGTSVSAAAAGTDFVAPSGALGTPSSGTLTNCTADGTNAVGYRNIPLNSQSAAYTLVLADAGKYILHPSADTSARVFTIPANASVAFPIGTAVTFVNQNGAGVVTIDITTDTMRLAGDGGVGPRALSANGVATALKIAATEWIVSGSGLI